MITKDKWVWMPHPAHFICAKDCRFFLATKVGKYIVSTVGEYWPDYRVRKIHLDVENKLLKKGEKEIVIEGIGDEWDLNYYKKFGYTDIGLDIKYETMVFKSVRVSKNKNSCGSCKYVIESGDNKDFEGYNSGEDAYKGHMKMCMKWAKKQ